MLHKYTVYGRLIAYDFLLQRIAGTLHSLNSMLNTDKRTTRQNLLSQIDYAKLLKKKHAQVEIVAPNSF